MRRIGGGTAGMWGRRSPGHARLVAAVLCLMAGGCSRPSPPPLGRVHGVVTLDGVPLAGAIVLFTPDGPGRTSGGITDAEGRYTLTYLREIPGANLGWHTVRMTTATEENGRRERVPVRYRGEKAPRAEVLAGDNAIDFPLGSGR